MKKPDRFSETIISIDSFCKKNNFKYCIIGGTALLYYNNFRTTKDIDVTINIEFENLEKLADDILSSFKPLLPNPKEFFMKNFVLPVYLESTDVRIDITPGLTGFDKNTIKRSKKVKIGEITAYICSIEDLIIYKLIAGRPQDFVDIGELFNNNKVIDKEYLLKTASRFIELEREDIYVKLQEFLNKYTQ